MKIFKCHPLEILTNNDNNESHFDCFYFGTRNDTTTTRPSASSVFITVIISICIVTQILSFVFGCHVCALLPNRFHNYRIAKGYYQSGYEEKDDGD